MKTVRETVNLWDIVKYTLIATLLLTNAIITIAFFDPIFVGEIKKEVKVISKLESDTGRRYLTFETVDKGSQITVGVTSNFYESAEVGDTLTRTFGSLDLYPLFFILYAFNFIITCFVALIFVIAAGETLIELMQEVEVPLGKKKVVFENEEERRDYNEALRKVNSYLKDS